MSEGTWTADPDAAPTILPQRGRTRGNFGVLPELRATGERVPDPDDFAQFEAWLESRGSLSASTAPALRVAGRGVARSAVRGARMLGKAGARFGLGLAGLGAIVAGAFTVGLTVGLISTGVALFAADRWVNG